MVSSSIRIYRRVFCGWMTFEKCWCTWRKWHSNGFFLLRNGLTRHSNIIMLYCLCLATWMVQRFHITQWRREHKTVNLLLFVLRFILLSDSRWFCASYERNILSFFFSICERTRLFIHSFRFMASIQFVHSFIYQQLTTWIQHLFVVFCVSSFTIRIVLCVCARALVLTYAAMMMMMIFMRSTLIHWRHTNCCMNKCDTTSDRIYNEIYEYNQTLSWSLFSFSLHRFMSSSPSCSLLVAFNSCNC